MAMESSEDVLELERAGRRCAVCRTGRRWREFEVLREEGQAPIVLCPACRQRYRTAPPVVAAPPAPAAEVAREKPAKPAAQRQPPREDRLKKALRELPRGEHSVSRIAKAAGVNHEKALRRLHALATAGEIQQVGSRWSNEPPSTDIEAAMDRLQARTSNLRIIKERSVVD